MDKKFETKIKEEFLESTKDNIISDCVEQVSNLKEIQEHSCYPFVEVKNEIVAKDELLDTEEEDAANDDHFEQISESHENQTKMSEAGETGEHSKMKSTFRSGPQCSVMHKQRFYNTDKYVTRSRDRNKGFSTNSLPSSAITNSSFRSSSPILNESCNTYSHKSLCVPPTVILNDEMGKAGDQSQEGNEEAVKELKSYLETLESFYVFDKFVRTYEKVDGMSLRKIHNGLAECQHPSCKGKKVFTYSTRTRYHLKQHYKNMHKDQLSQFSAAIEGLSKRGRPKSRESEARKKRRMCKEESLRAKFNQERARQGYNRWFIETMTPLAVADHPGTKKMFYLVNPEFQPTSRRTVSRDIDQLMERGKTQLINLLFHQKWVATTADSWTAHNRSFLGMTVHWIDRDTLKRRHATLACKEVKESQTHQLLGKLITEIHQDFSINGKVAATTTDNGTNYVAAFNAFGEVNQDQEDLPVDPEYPDLEIVDLQERLRAEGDNPSLPPHHRCSAHTVNLLATKNARDVQGWSKGGSDWRRTISKIQALWNLQNSAPVAANQIKEVAKRKLKTPVATRWNSLYDSVVVLLEVLSVRNQLNAINTILINQPNGGSPITEVDIQVLKEYILVMQPVAQCLDMLQGEKKAYMGTLLPYLWLMKTSLEEQIQNDNLVYARPLVRALLCGYENRFAHLFQNRGLLMAIALHPAFTLKALESIAPDKVEEIRDRITRELSAVIKPRMEEQQQRKPGQSEAQEPQDTDAHLFNKLFAREPIKQQQDVRDVLRKSMEEWMPSKGELAWSLFPYQHREVWIDLFLKYNTPLPSSAAVERLFSTTGDILRAKRSSLDETNFEELVFLKGNMNLLEDKMDMEEEENL